MHAELRKLSVADGEDIHAMLQEMPADENGYANMMYSATYDEYKT